MARADLRAYEESVRLPPAELVGRLRDLLGAKLVAYADWLGFAGMGVA